MSLSLSVSGDLLAPGFHLAIFHALLPELLPASVDISGRIKKPSEDVRPWRPSPFLSSALKVLEAARYPIAMKYLAMKAPSADVRAMSKLPFPRSAAPSSCISRYILRIFSNSKAQKICWFFRGPLGSSSSRGGPLRRRSSQDALRTGGPGLLWHRQGPPLCLCFGRRGVWGGGGGGCLAGARSARCSLLLSMALTFCSLSPLICALGLATFGLCRLTYGGVGGGKLIRLLSGPAQPFQRRVSAGLLRDDEAGPWGRILVLAAAAPSEGLVPLRSSGLFRASKRNLPCLQLLEQSEL